MSDCPHVAVAVVVPAPTSTGLTGLTGLTMLARVRLAEVDSRGLHQVPAERRQRSRDRVPRGAHSP
jgi:hypothetical protein